MPESASEGGAPRRGLERLRSNDLVAAAPPPCLAPLAHRSSGRPLRSRVSRRRMAPPSFRRQPTSAWSVILAHMTALERKQKLVHSFVVTEESLRHLDQICSVAGPVLYSVELEDNTVRHRLTVEQVLSLSNVKGSRVRALEANAYVPKETTDRPEGSPKWEARFSGSPTVFLRVENPQRPLVFVFSNIECEARLPEEKIKAFGADFDNWIRAVRAPYARRALASVFLIFLLGILLSLAAYSAWFATALTAKIKVDHTYGMLPGTIVTIGTLLLSGTIIVIRPHLYPIGTFVWGATRIEFQRAENIRFAVGLGFLLSVGGSLVASLIYAAL